MTYTQLEDPENAGTYESFTCQTTYTQTQSHTPIDNVKVRNYYGPGRFSSTEEVGTGANTLKGDQFIDINYEGLMYD